MTKIRFYAQDKLLTGYEVSGHSTVSSDDFEGKLVCSAVSSAAYMAVNTLTEIIGASVEAEVNDGFMSVKLTSKLSEAQTVLKGFELHCKDLAKQYRNYLKVYSEV